MSRELYRFLLVDDEEIITKGISENIDWESEGFEFLPPCSDGLEAIESIKANNPDVVLTDICMPEADGLDVVRFVYENAPDTLTLILSGYDEFEYAQQAMSLRVMDFLLKPISSKTLKKHLFKIREALAKRDERMEARQKLQTLVDKSRQAVSDRYLSRLIAGSASRPDADLLCDELDFLNNMEWFSVICLEMDTPENDSETSALSQELLFLTIDEACTRALKGLNDFARITTAENRIVIIMGRHKEQSLSLKAASTASMIIEEVQNTGLVTASAGIGKAVRRSENIYTSYRQAVTALQHRLIAGNNGIFIFKPGEFKDLEPRLSFNKCGEDIRRDIRTGSRADSLNTCRIFLDLLRNGCNDPKQARREIIKFVSIVIDVIEEIGIAEAELNGRGLTEFLYNLMDVISLDDLNSQLKRFFEAVENILREKRESFPKKKFYEIKRYIDSNFTDADLSVESIAEKFFISTGYLTRLFRQNLDQSCLEYITARKMDKAVELLKTSECKNYEIAEKLGYNDPHYFSASFKRHFGQTPSEFKNNL